MRRYWPFSILLLVLGGLAFAWYSRDPAIAETRALARGKNLLAKGDYGRSLLEFRNAIQAMPKDAEAHYQAGLAALGKGDLRAALDYFNTAARLNPAHTDARMKAAEMMALSGDRQLIGAAERSLTEMLQASPSNLDLLDMLAEAEAELNKPEEAVRHLQQALEKSPGRLASSIALSKIKLAQKDTAGAEEVLRQALQQDSKSAAPLLALAAFYLQTGRIADAQTQIQHALEIDPQNGPGLFGLAVIQSQTGKNDEAERIYQRLAELPDKRYKHLHAMFLLETGKTEAAIPELENLAKADANDRDARSRLVVAYASTGRTGQAQTILSAALLRNPRDMDALLQKCQLDLQNGQTAGVEDGLRQVLHFRPDLAEAHFALAKFYGMVGSPQIRRQELIESVRLSPRLVPARTELARVLIIENSALAALDVIRQAPEDQRELLPVVLSRIWAMHASGDEAGARKELESRLAAQRDPDLVFLDAVLKLWRLDYAGAQRGAEEVLGKKPEDLRALRLVLDSYAAQNKTVEAERRIRLAAAQRPQSAPIQYLLGQWLMQHGDAAGARGAFQSAKAADPQFAEAVFALADLDLADGRTDPARQGLTDLLSRDARNPDIHLRLAALEDKAGNPSAVIEHLRTVVDLDSRNAMALNNLAYLLAKTDPDGALKYAEKAGELASQNPAIEDTLGWIYYRKKLYSLAIRHLKIAVEKGATPRRQFHLGMAYKQSGEQALAVRIIADALKMDPTLAVSERDW